MKKTIGQYKAKISSYIRCLLPKFVVLLLVLMTLNYLVSTFNPFMQNLQSSKSSVALLKKSHELTLNLARIRKKLVRKMIDEASQEQCCAELELIVSSLIERIKSHIDSKNPVPQGSKKIIDEIDYLFKDNMAIDSMDKISDWDRVQKINHLVNLSSLLAERAISHIDLVENNIVPDSINVFFILKDIQVVLTSLDMMMLYHYQGELLDNLENKKSTIVNNAYLKSDISIEDIVYRLSVLRIHSGDYKNVILDEKIIAKTMEDLFLLVEGYSVGKEVFLSVNRLENEFILMSERLVNSLANVVERVVILKEERRFRILIIFVALCFLFFMVFVLVWKTKLHSEKERLKNISKTNFLAKMSHEIRTPMNGVMGVAELLSATPLNADQVEYVSVIKSSGSTLLAIIDDILDYSKIEAGKIQLECVRIDFCKLIQKSAKMFGYKALNKGVFMFMLAQEGIPQIVLGDPTRLQQVVNNLLSNAVKFTEYGSITIEVSFRMNSQQKATFKVSVEDTGIGISRDDSADIFERFSQARDDITRRYGGTGLGLSIARQLLDLMGGRIDVDGIEGKGTKFTFEITLRVVSEEGDSGQVDSSKNSMRILLLDPANRMKKLTERGVGFVPNNFTCTKNPSNEELKSIVSGKNYEALVAVVDVHDADEMSVFRRVNNEIDPNVKGLLVSSHNVTRSGDSHLKEFDFVLVKPVVSFDGIVTSLAPGLSVEKGSDKSLTNSAEVEGIALVAEDNPVNQMVIKCMLMELNYKAEIVENGQLAFNLYAKDHERFDLILLDCEMPVMGGFECTEKIREFEVYHKLSPVPVYTVSAHVLPEIVKKGKEVGVDGHLNKPVTLSNLQDILQDSVRIKSRLGLF